MSGSGAEPSVPERAGSGTEAAAAPRPWRTAPRRRERRSPPRDCASSECPAEAVGTERRRTEREEDGEEEKSGAGGPDGSEPKRRESGARAESAEKGHESGDGACGSTAEKRGEPRDGAPVGGGERKEDVGGGLAG